MIFVVDANVVISCIIKRAITFDVFLLNSVLPYLALALKFECPIFSGDRTLKRLTPVKVLSPREVLKLL